MTFNDWFDEIDEMVREDYGIGAADLSDLPFRDGYDSGMSPVEFFNEHLQLG